ncbi:MAG: Rossmann-like and DUF2520 domain-containing protein [Flavobacteriaceae bacterium]
MINVIVLGGGNVATQLTKAFYKARKCKLVQVYSRSQPSKFVQKKNINTTQNLSDLKDADVYIIAISDDAISDFSSHLKFQNKLVVHTSGSVIMTDLKCNANKGVFYPLQSISKSKKISFKHIPICIETENDEDLLLLETLANSISKKVYHINSKQREKLHLAAVFVNNFVNHLYHIGHEICDENKVDFNILKPLIKETAAKIKNLTPRETQTGPAIRKDIKTLESQRQLLDENKKNIYNLLTESIMNS